MILIYLNLVDLLRLGTYFEGFIKKIYYELTYEGLKFSIFKIQSIGKFQ